MIFAAACSYLFLAMAAVPAGAILWSEPPPPETVDFKSGAGGGSLAPKPPFRFVREDYRGTSAKVIVRDSADVEWRVKGGHEARAESFATRFVSALGYYAEPTYFVRSGKLEGSIGQLRRARGFIKSDGTFSFAAFERRDPTVKFLDQEKWTWGASPFAGTRELSGLRVLMMLLSNWDNKDSRNYYKGSNTAVIQKTSPSGQQKIYMVTDWGQSLGSWPKYWLGIGGGEPWNCMAFREQTPEFIHGSNDREVLFGYRGQHTADFRSGISRADVEWLMGYLGRISDNQIRDGLEASGATSQEVDCFATELRKRIEQLRSVAAKSKAAR